MATPNQEETDSSSYKSDEINNRYQEGQMTSHITSGLNILKQDGTEIEEFKSDFIHELAELLPAEADPFMETDDGSEVDVYWEDMLIITLTNENTIAVSDFFTGAHNYKYFERNETHGALDYIQKCYFNWFPKE